MYAHTRRQRVHEESDNNGCSSKRFKSLQQDISSESNQDIDHSNAIESPYYLTYFKECVSYVKSSLEGHVIASCPEKGVLDSFNDMNEPYQQILVRLYLRKHKWLRVDKLSYPKIASDLIPLIKELIKRNLLKDESFLIDTQEILTLLQSPELKLLCKQLHQPASVINQPKHQCISSLIEHFKKQRPLLPHLSPLDALNKKAKSLLGKCVHISPECVNVFSRVMLLYSLLTTGDSSEEVTPQSIIFHRLQVNKGEVIYPQYECNITRPLFLCQTDFDNFYTVFIQQQKLASLIADKCITPSLLREIVDNVSELFLNELQSHTCTTTVTIEEPLVTTGTCKDEFTNTPPLKDTSNVVMVCDNKERDQRLFDVIDLTVDDEISCEPYLSVLYLCTCLPVSRFWCQFRAGSICICVLTSCMESWEKLRDYGEANRLLELCLSQTVFGCHRRGNWWARLSLNLDSHLRKPLKSLQCIKTALADPFVHDSVRYTLSQRAHKLCSSLEKKQSTFNNYKITDFPSPCIKEHREVTLTGTQQPTTCLFITTSQSSDSTATSLCSVEGFAIHYYTNIEGWANAVHAEGSSLVCLFVCLMWDCIFTGAVPDVFRGPYQVGPLDFGRELFYLSRKEQIDQRLEWIRQAQIDDVVSEIATCWTTHFGKNVFGINWELFPNGCEDVKGIAYSLGNQTLAKTCELFSKDYYSNRGGVPDLILWNRETKTSKFVEVKGPGDRLSSKQVLWLSRLMEWSCQVEVCRVTANRD